jgi:septal ring factor EnvC (AmiA/AmiB activator)
MRALILWLFNKIVPWIEQSLDPELKGRLDALNARVAEAEAKEKEAEQAERESQEAYAASVRRRQELAEVLAESRRLQALDEEALRESEQRRKEIRDEVSNLKNAVDNRSDDDAIFGGVPKSRTGAAVGRSGSEDPPAAR